MYRPLSDYLTIKESDIEGLGLFATKNIPAGTNLGITHYFILDKIIRTPLGGHYNHSTLDANCYTEISKGYACLITKGVIEAGQELTAFYKIEPLSSRSITDNATDF
jgi:hypothetical protein